MGKGQIEVMEQQVIGKDGVARRLQEEHDDPMERVPYWVAFTTYFGYTWLILIGFVRDLIGRKIFRGGTRPKAGYAPLLADFEDFYQRRLYMRTHDVFDRPICSAPGPHIDVMLRDFQLLQPIGPANGETKRCLNLGSYNYLGFAVNGGADDKVYQTLKDYSIATCCPRTEVGTAPVHVELEKTIASFVGKPAAIVVGMGFATNSTLIPCLLGKGGLIISDQLNHTSIVQGARCSRAKIKTFKHNDPESLEQVIRTAIAEGQPGFEAYKPWKKIVILVEGLYSMEGSICRLPPIIELKKKYNCYLWVDEAHSIGALGANGKGVLEYWGCEPADVDVLMGTFTKSFGSVGGYVASTVALVEHMKAVSASSTNAVSMSPACAAQCIYALKVMTGEIGGGEGVRKIRQLCSNAAFFRRRLKEMGCHVLGDDDSPIVPVMLYSGSKIPAFSRECLERGLAVVVVGFPAVPLLLGRVRFCLSAAHTTEMLEEALQKIDEVADMTMIKYDNY